MKPVVSGLMLAGFWMKKSSTVLWHSATSGLSGASPSLDAQKSTSGLHRSLMACGEGRRRGSKSAASALPRGGMARRWVSSLRLMDWAAPMSVRNVRLRDVVSTFFFDFGTRGLRAHRAISCSFSDLLESFTNARI